MEVDLLDTHNLKKLLDSLDKDCAIRLTLSAIAGRNQFLKQLNIEATIQVIREETRNKNTKGVQKTK